MKGYYVFLVFFYMTVWSVMLGTMIGMFDFIKQLPYPENFLGGKTSRDLILHIVSTLLCYVLCCIRNTKSRLEERFTPRQLFFVSWFGIFTLVLSYVVVLVYAPAHAFRPSRFSSTRRFCGRMTFAPSSPASAWRPTRWATTSAS